MSNRGWFNLFCVPGAILGTLFLTPALRAAEPVSRADVAIAGGAVPPVNSWATLHLTLPSLSGGNITVELQDRRGGPIVRRRLAVYRRHILMPLPYVAGATGSSRAWPVVVKLFRAGKMQRVMQVHVDLPVARVGGAVIVGVPGAVRSQLPAVALALGKPVTPVLFSRRQLAASPVLNFATCRWLLLNRVTARQLPRRRVSALLSLGIRLIYLGTAPNRVLPAPFWRNTGKTAAVLPIWKTVRLHGFSHGPPMVVPHLSRMRLPGLHAPTSWEITAWAIGPLTIIMLILLRWAVPGQWYLIVSMAIGVALLSLAAICFLTATTTPAQTTFQWQTEFPAAPVRLRTTIRIQRALHGSSRAATHTRGITLPLAWSARAWLAFHGVITLHANTSTLAYRITRHVTILACQTTASIRPKLPGGNIIPPTAPSGALAVPLPKNYTALFARGQIFLPPHPHHGRDFYNWLNSQPTKVQPVLRLWLLLQFNPHRRYALCTTASRLRIMPLTHQTH